jgi:hypothetical protein
MSRDHWDAILASAPLNATAGAVTSKGYQYEPEIGSRNIHEWDAPPPLMPVSDTHIRNTSFVDLTGRVIGRLTVLGMMRSDPSQKALWVCRCACGKYIGQRARALKSGNRDRCDTCDHNAYLVQAASGNNARQRAESPEARKWTAEPSSPTTVKEPR